MFYRYKYSGVGNVLVQIYNFFRLDTWLTEYVPVKSSLWTEEAVLTSRNHAQ